MTTWSCTGYHRHSAEPGHPSAKRSRLPRDNYTWWSSQINNSSSPADPVHLPIYPSNDVLPIDGASCCRIGCHGTRAAGLGSGNTKSTGNAAVQTFAGASRSWQRRDPDGSQMADGAQFPVTGGRLSEEPPSRGLAR